MSQYRLDTEIQKGAGASFFISVASAGLVFFAHLWLARWMGEAEYGLLAYLFSYINILVVPSTLGLVISAQRFLPGYLALGKVADMRGFLSFSIRTSFWLAVFLGLGWAAVMWLTRGSGLPDSFQWALAGGVILLILAATGSIMAATLRAFRHVISSQGPQGMLEPVLLLLLACILFQTSGRLDAGKAMGCKVFAAFTALVILAGLLRKYSPPELAGTKGDARERRKWLDASFFLFIITACHMAMSQTGTILAGALTGPEEAGVFFVCEKIATISAFVLIAFNYIGAPKMAALWTLKDMRQLRNLIGSLTPRIFLLTLPIALGLVVFSRSILGLFGPGFIRGWPVLVLLVTGHVICTCTGTVGSLLVMTGHQKKCVPPILTCAVMNVGLAALGILLWGLPGAALAWTVSVVVCNGWFVMLAYRILRINTTVFQVNAWGRQSYRAGVEKEE